MGLFYLTSQATLHETLITECKKEWLELEVIAEISWYDLTDCWAPEKSVTNAVKNMIVHVY